MNSDPTAGGTPRGAARSGDATVLPIVFLMLVLLIGTLYTLRQCAILLQKIQERHQRGTAATQAEHLATETLRSHRAQQNELEKELRSVQQLQAEVKTQLADLKHMVAQYQASQQQQQNADTKQD